MKLALVLFFACLIFIPTSAFGWKSLSYQKNDCNIDCNNAKLGIDHAAPFNFFVLAALSIIGLGLYYQMHRVGKFETFSLKCKICGRQTNGLKCNICQTRKQKAI